MVMFVYFCVLAVREILDTSVLSTFGNILGKTLSCLTIIVPTLHRHVCYMERRVL